ncbi:hypothetical protein PVAND_001315 [Polypedilum vanderplanki]|uniref:C2H2-type domain-containing protein n=1 Tax=Polypedilum vanderplanki TaxID=319348 RepID=A0A9J6BN13_POLVA|nr:hypothetical protein PVAND_001315 [Polypedilum vanderplanki]
MSLDEYYLNDESCPIDEEQFTIIFDRNEAREINNRLTNDLNEAKTQNEILKSQKLEIEEQINKISLRLAAAIEENKNLHKIIKQKDHKISEINQEFKKSKDEFNLQIKFVETQKEIRKFEFEEKIKKYSIKLKTVETENKKLHEQIGQKDLKIDKLNEEIVNLKNELKTLKQNREVKNEKEEEEKKENIVYECVEPTLVLNPFALCENTTIENDTNIVLQKTNEEFHLSLSDRVMIINELLASEVKTPEKQKKFKCFICDKVYHKKCILKRHLKSHEKEKDRVHRSGRHSGDKIQKVIKTKAVKLTKDIKCIKCNKIMKSVRGLKIHDTKAHSVVSKTPATNRKLRSSQKSNENAKKRNSNEDIPTWNQGQIQITPLRIEIPKGLAVKKFQKLSQNSHRETRARQTARNIKSLFENTPEKVQKAVKDSPKTSQKVVKVTKKIDRKSIKEIKKSGRPIKETRRVLRARLDKEEKKKVIHITMQKKIKDKKHECPTCEFETNSRKYFYLHVDKHDENRSKFKCNSCNYSTNLQIELNVHKHVHLENYSSLNKCHFCEYANADRNSVSKHMKIHTAKEL